MLVLGGVPILFGVQPIEDSSEKERESLTVKPSYQLSQTITQTLQPRLEVPQLPPPPFPFWNMPLLHPFPQRDPQALPQPQQQNLIPPLPSQSSVRPPLPKGPPPPLPSQAPFPPRNFAGTVRPDKTVCDANLGKFSLVFSQVLIRRISNIVLPETSIVQSEADKDYRCFTSSSESYSKMDVDMRSSWRPKLPPPPANFTSHPLNGIRPPPLPPFRRQTIRFAPLLRHANQSMLFFRVSSSF